MKPRVTITNAHQRPIDESFAYFVKYYERGLHIMWTDSREYAEQFAPTKRHCARPAIVQERAAWALNRRIGLTEPVVT